MHSHPNLSALVITLAVMLGAVGYGNAIHAELTATTVDSEGSVTYLP